MKIPASTEREKQAKIKISSSYMQQVCQWKSEILTIAMVWSQRNFHKIFIYSQPKKWGWPQTKLNRRNVMKIVSMWLLYWKIKKSCLCSIFGEERGSYCRRCVKEEFRVHIALSLLIWITTMWACVHSIMLNLRWLKG